VAVVVAAAAAAVLLLLKYLICDDLNWCLPFQSDSRTLISDTNSLKVSYTCWCDSSTYTYSYAHVYNLIMLSITNSIIIM